MASQSDIQICSRALCHWTFKPERVEKQNPPLATCVSTCSVVFYLCHNFSITYFFYTFIEAFSIDGDISKTDKIDNNVIHVPQIVIMVIWSYEKKNNSREQMINFPMRYILGTCTIRCIQEIAKCLPVIEEFKKQPGLLPIASHYMVPLTSQLNKMGHLFAEDDDRNEVLCIETANSGARFWRRVCWDGLSHEAKYSALLFTHTTLTRVTSHRQIMIDTAVNLIHCQHVIRYMYRWLIRQIGDRYE
ncbi:unnamed protein product [Albugo candida]|uniref:Uncharacterized protein n=1 Tax=Albugo candida TaxID=65357 RepID=A0A024FXK5_9STRA|nr:unnamed protein product [Albugo candida]|eukprot:CCI11637.1 unnamed protein product [Albugo candida]